MSTTERLTPEQTAERIAADYVGQRDDVVLGRHDFVTALADAIKDDRANGAQAVLDSATFADLFTVAVTGCRTEYVSVHRNDRTDMHVDELGHIAHEVYDDMMQEVFA